MMSMLKDKIKDKDIQLKKVKSQVNLINLLNS